MVCFADIQSMHTRVHVSSSVCLVWDPRIAAQKVEDEQKNYHPVLLARWLAERGNKLSIR